DANVTTLLAAGALYQYTSGPVRGFAITLAIGIVASVFVNLVVVPYVLDLFTAKNPRSFMWHGFDIRGLEFVKRGPVVVAVTGLLAIASLVWVTVFGLPMSTDFTGGTNLTLVVSEETTTAEVRQGLAALELEGLDPENATIVEATDQSGQHQIIVRTALADTELGGTGDLGPRLADEIGAELLQAEFVGPAIGADLRRGAVNAVLMSLGLILIYVG